MTPFQAVLFDFDGVIAHTAPIIQQAMWRFFRERQISIAETEFNNNSWASKSLAQVCVLLKEKYHIELGVDEIRANIWQTQVACFETGIESDPTLIAFLEYCRKSNIRLSIGSNSIGNRVEWVIKKMRIDKYFAGIVGANDIIHHKPDPEVWIKCAEMIEAPIELCLVIEDGLPGLTGAKVCGARGIYYHRFCRPEKACMEIAEKSVESFSEILENLQ